MNENNDFGSNMDEVIRAARVLSNHVKVQVFQIEAYRIALEYLAQLMDRSGMPMDPKTYSFMEQLAKTMQSGTLEHIEANYEKLWNTYRSNLGITT